MRSRVGPKEGTMKRFRWHLVILAILVAVALTALLAHSVRVRLIWGSSGFVLGLICGIALVLRVQRLGGGQF